MSKSLEIRGTKKQQRIGTLAGWLVRVIGWTLRYKVTGLELLSEQYSGKPVIFAFWHNRIIAVLHVLSRLSQGHEMVGLTSASKDGAILENAIKVFGAGAVRGSSSRRGAAALVALRKKINAGVRVFITPDGPRGPMQELQSGVVKLSQVSGAPIVVINVKFCRAWRVNSWDEFNVPWPFSKVVVTIEEGVVLPRQMNQDEFEQQRVAIEALMNKDETTV